MNEKWFMVKVYASINEDTELDGLPTLDEALQGIFDSGIRHLAEDTEIKIGDVEIEFTSKNWLSPSWFE